MYSIFFIVTVFNLLVRFSPPVKFLFGEVISGKVLSGEVLSSSQYLNASPVDSIKSGFSALSNYK
jgi:hypothetical protein